VSAPDMRGRLLDRVVNEALFLLCVGSVFLLAFHLFVRPLRRRVQELEGDVQALGVEVRRLEGRLRVLRAHVAAARFDPHYLEAAARVKLRLRRNDEIPLWHISESPALSDTPSSSDAPQPSHALIHKSVHPKSQGQQDKGRDRDRRGSSQPRNMGRSRCIQPPYSRR